MKSKALLLSFVLTQASIALVAQNYPPSLVDEWNKAPLDGTTKQLVVCIHGWNPPNPLTGQVLTDAYGPPTSAWGTLVSDLLAQLPGANWQLLLYHWEQDANTGLIDWLDAGYVQQAVNNATEAANRADAWHGPHSAEQLNAQAPNLRQVHFIAHSAGSWLARAAAIRLLELNPYVTVQVTLLDPYIPGSVPVPWTPVTPLDMNAMDSIATDAHQDRIYRLENYWSDDLETLGTNNPLFDWRPVIDILGLEVNWPQDFPVYYVGHTGPISFYADEVSAAAGSLPDALVFAPFEYRDYAWFKSMFYQALILPHIASQPQGPATAASDGTSVTLNVAAVGLGSLSYRWLHDAQPIPGATAASYSFVASFSTAGDYVVEVSNDNGFIFSDEVTVTVVPEPTVAQPTISPFGGSFSGSTTVTLGCSTAGAAIYYTLNGGTPTPSDMAYAGPFILTSSATVTARAFLTGCNPSPVTTASFSVATTPGTVAITLATIPTGLLVSVDGGTASAAPLTVNWTPGDTHRISAPSPQTSADGHTAYTFASWSDGGAPAHTITTPSLGKTFTASFTPQYKLDINVSPDASSGNVTPTPACPWYNPGQVVSLTADAFGSYSFSSRSGVDSQSGDAAQLTMNSYRSVTASFSTRPSGAGSIRVSIVPQAAADQGAQWKLTTESQWHSSGASTTVPSLGDYVVQFNTISGWDTPGNISLTLFPAQTDVWVNSDPYTQQPVLPLYENFMGIAFGDNTFVVVPGALLPSGPSGVWSVVTTQDAINWARQPTFNDTRPDAITYANNLFIALGDMYACKIATSSDGTNWTKRLVSGDSSSFSGAIYGNGKFIAVGSSGKVATSPDGFNWTVSTPGAWGESGGIAFGANRFVTVDSDAGIPYMSTDGINWTATAAPGTGSGLFGPAFGQNTFVAVGWAGKVITSSDGTTWASATSSVSDLLTGIAFANSQFVAVGDNGTVVTSSDGLNWVRRNMGTTQTLRGVAYGNNTFMAAGWNGTILPLGGTFSPLIAQQPASQAAQVGQEVVFTVTADAPGAISYQWQYNGTDIPGETDWMLTVPNVGADKAGDYTVAVSTPSAVQISQPATLTVNQGIPVLTWVTPSDIEYGTPLGSEQLNATASVPGTFAYSPLTGAVLAAGNARMLSVTFTPTDTANYAVTTATVSINVTPALLTVTAKDGSRTYGSANSSFTGAITGLQNSDNITASYSCSATLSSPVGLYAIVPTLSDPGGKLSNYAVTVNDGALTVSSASLAVTADNESRAYGAPNPQLTGSVTGVQNGDNITANYNCSATASSPVSTYPIVPVLNDPGNMLGNYNVTLNNGTLVVTPAPASVTVNLTTLTQVYDASLKVVTADTIPAGLTVTLTYSGNLTPPTATGVYSVTATVNDPNYSGSTTGTLTVSPAFLTVTGITAANKPYDGTTSATLNTAAAMLNGVLPVDAGNVTLVTSGATGSFADRNVGTAKPVTLSGLTLSGSAAPNYTLAQPTTSASITALGLTTSGITAANRPYDGTTIATLYTTGATLNGVLPVNAANVALVTSGATGTFADKNVGTVKLVTVSGLTLNGNAAPNYTLAQPATSASITALSLTASGITAANKPYDGTTIATLNTTSATLNGVLPLDASNVTLATSAATGTFADKSVGTAKLVTVGGLTLSGNAAPNYTLAQPTTSASITALSLTASGITAANKPYDGTTSATLNTAGATLNGVLPADTGNVTVVTSTATGTFADKNVGTAKLVTVSGLTLSGSAAPNYTLVQPTTSASITALGLTVAGVTAANRPYDGTMSATLTTSGATLIGVLPVDAGNVTLVTSGATGSFADRNVGTAKLVVVSGLTLSGTAAGDYTLAQPTTSASITALGLTASGITAANKVYDGTTSATLNTAGATLNGVLPVDTGNVTLLTTTATGTLGDKNVGTAKLVTVSGLTLSGNAAPNYALAQPTTSASITALSLTASGITAANKVYDGTTSATLNTAGVTLNGVLPVDTGNVTLLTTTATGTFGDKNVGTAKLVTVSGLTLGGSAAPNYTLAQPTTSANITALGLTVTGITAANKPYDGTTSATLNTAGATLNGGLSVDAGNLALVTSGATGSFADRNVGTAKPVTVNGLTLSGSAAPNYTLAQPTTTADITALPLTLTGITAANKLYDGTTAATLNTTNGLLNGVLPTDTGNVTLMTSGAIGAFSDPSVGTNKLVTISGLALGGSAAGDYTLTQPTTTADILPSPGLKISSPALVGHSLSVSVPTAAGLSYTLEYKDSLTEPAWTAAQTLPGTGGPITLTDSTATSTSRFYRVRGE